MSIFAKLFPATPAAQPAATNTAPQPAPAAPIAGTVQSTAANTAIPTQQTVAPAVEKTGLDKFEGLWENDPNAKPADNKNFNFNISPEQLKEISAKMDFSALLTPELKQQIAAGGEQAVQATMQLNNLVARQMYEHNALTTTKLVQAAYDNAQATIDERIAQKFKTLGLAENIATNNPALTHPVIAPLVKDVQQRFIEKFPNASSTEIQQKVNEYMQAVGAAFNPEMAKAANTKPNPFNPGAAGLQPETDWAAFFNS
jgi:hypothetical protein